jgi:hypothetical protein
VVSIEFPETEPNEFNTRSTIPIRRRCLEAVQSFADPQRFIVPEKPIFPSFGDTYRLDFS